ncbi:quinone oxidoreductase [Sporosarcina ureae]|uniref:NADP-dependent oxidoreductase n=1 Tax=Sporosarcina ureae TaxID=1571 RepID=UPI000A167894|nr:NADP-dependent oxidoreductase [Sporosarcina ureae]ARJ38956.1 quinone oxidoreductase [Sporosarcina ureae]
MKAIVKQSAKTNDIALLEVPVPEINNDELLIEVRAIGVGIHDEYFLPQNISYPYTIGIEAAGVVQEVGSSVSSYEKGDRIAFISMLQPKGGTWAEYVAVHKDSLSFRIPENMTFEQAAAIPVAGNTALKAIEPLQLRPGNSIFIAGASGAIGTFLIQLAKEKGYVVASSASKRNHQYMKELGADFTVDYRDANWQQQITDWMPGGVDAAIAVQPKTTTDSMKVVKDGGHVTSISGDQVPSERGVSVEIVSHQLDIRNELSRMVKRIADNDMKLVIEEVYPFAEGFEALKKTQTRHARGKLVLSMNK